ncbi:MAG: hypothetical protein KDI36_08180, partial [Pseudomonadales bacterium]|nr:hypothetical protein [Pseudomonadales bacterium]
MLNKLFPVDELLLYRVGVIVGVPVLLVGGYLMDQVRPPGDLTLSLRYLASLFAVVCLIFGYKSRFMQEYTGEFGLVLAYLLITYSCLVLVEGRIGALEGLYGITALALMTVMFHKAWLVLAYQIPALLAISLSALMVSEPMMNPWAYILVALVFSVVTSTLALTHIHTRKRRESSEALSDLWFEQGTDAHLYGYTQTATPIRVNQTAYDLLECDKPEEVASILVNAFRQLSKTPDEANRALKDALAQEVYSQRMKIRTAKGNEFWGDLAMRRQIVDGDDLIYVRVTDTSDQVAHEQELEEARMAAEAAAETRSRFLANMSHEIRTPMNGVIGMASLLMETELTPQQQSYVDTIRGSGETLLSIINEILDFSKIDANRIELEQQVFDLETCATEALDLVAPTAASKHLELIFEMSVSRNHLWLG